MAKEWRGFSQGYRGRGRGDNHLNDPPRCWLFGGGLARACFTSPLSLLPSLLKLSDFDKVPGVLESRRCLRFHADPVWLPPRSLHPRHSLSSSLCLSLPPCSFLFLFHQDLRNTVLLAVFLPLFLCTRLDEFSTRNDECCASFLFIAARLDRHREGGKRREYEGKLLVTNTYARIHDDYFFLNESSFSPPARSRGGRERLRLACGWDNAIGSPARKRQRIPL